MERLTDTDRAYFAGLVDGCGSIRVQRRMGGKTVVCREIILTLSGLSKKAVRWVEERFQGVHTGVKNTPSRGVVMWRITFQTRWAATALAHVAEFLKIKESEARLVFRFADATSQRGVRLSSEQMRVRAEVDHELSALQRSR